MKFRSCVKELNFVVCKYLVNNTELWIWDWRWQNIDTEGIYHHSIRWLFSFSDISLFQISLEYSRGIYDVNVKLFLKYTRMGALPSKPGNFNCSVDYIASMFPLFHDDVIKWKYFPRYWPFVRGIHRSFDVFFDIRPNKRLSEHWWCWWFETPSRPLWRHCNVLGYLLHISGTSYAHIVYRILWCGSIIISIELQLLIHSLYQRRKLPVKLRHWYVIDSCSFIWM